MSHRKLAIEQRYFFAAAPEAVFKALTEPKQLVKWFLGSARIPPKQGSDFVFRWRGGNRMTGKVKKCEPNKSLVLSWNDVIKGEKYSTQASFTLTKKGKGPS